MVASPDRRRSRTSRNWLRVGRDEQVALWREDGATYRAIAELNDVSIQRARQLEARYHRQHRIPTAPALIRARERREREREERFAGRRGRQRAARPA